MKSKTKNKVFNWSVIVSLGGVLYGFTPLLGETLENTYIKIVISDAGQIRTIQNIRGEYNYDIESDFFSIVTDKGSFCNKDSKVLRVKRISGKVAYYYQLTQSQTIKLEYSLRPEAAYVERSLTISEGNEPLTLFSIEQGNTTFSNKPREILVYNTFWNASTVAFLRWDECGLFCSVENPFFILQQNNKTVSFQYEPSLILKEKEIHCSDPQFIGVFEKSGKQISDYYPQTVSGNRPRFRNPDGHKPLDLNEIKAMQRFVADYMDVSQNQFLGPYLDYPEEEVMVSEQEKLKICTLLPSLYTKSIVYDQPVDPDMPDRVSKEEEKLHIIKSAKMTPEFFLTDQKVTISVKLTRSKEEIEKVWISLPHSDAEMTYNKDSDEWNIQYTPYIREGIIMDVSFLRVWGVLKSGSFSDPVDIPVKWHYSK